MLNAISSFYNKIKKCFKKCVVEEIKHIEHEIAKTRVFE